MLTKRINALSTSITIAVSNLAADLKAEGKDILSFSAGEPDFDTPRPIKDAAITAINEGFTKYTAVDGIPELKQAIINKLKKENNLAYNMAGVIVNNGAKQSLFNLFSVVIEEEDEVIIPTPYWVTYPEIVKYCGGRVIEIATTDATNFKMTPRQLKDAITNKTKMLVLTSPSNPTGTIYSKDELTAIGKILEGTDILVASDEMYEKLIYDGQFTSTASVSDDMFKRTITINGLSKSAAMTGWRFGYMAAYREDIVQATKKLQSQSTSNINSITQKAAIFGLNGSIDKDVEKMRLEFQKRRDVAVRLFNDIDGLSVLSPMGAFYLFVNIKSVSNDSVAFCKDLLEKTGVAVVPGLGFGSEGYFRFSFATDTSSIEEGINRIKKYVATLK